MPDTLDPALWPQVSAAFDAALDLPATERDAWVAAQPEAVATPLRALLRAHDSGADLPALDAALAGVAAGQPGMRIGPYRLIERIGQGAWPRCGAPRRWTGRWPADAWPSSYRARASG